MGRARALGVVGLAHNPEHINPTTVMSLVMSGLSVIWQFLVRFFLGGGGRAQSEPGIDMNRI